MRTVWQTKKLREILGIQNGYAFDSKYFSYINGKPLIRIRDLKNGVTTQTKYSGKYDEQYIVNFGNLLIGMDGEFSCYEWRGSKALLNQRVCRLQDFQGLNPKFLFYGINKYLKEIEEQTSYITVKHISSKQIQDIRFSFPESLPEQHRIVKILDEVFEKIAKAKENAEKNLQNSKGLFESYLQEVFENKSESWDERSLGEVCKVERGSSPRPIDNYFTDQADGVNWIKIGDTKGVEKYIYTTRQKITKEGAMQSRFVDVDDFILSNSMSFGKPYIMKTQGYIHDGWFVLRLPKYIDTEFFWYLLASPYTMNQFISLAAGAIVKNISGDLVKKTILPIPPFNEQKSIVAKLDALSAETKKLETIYQQKINDLEELKKSILHKAFEGEL